MLLSKIVCHTFLCLSQPRPLKMANGNTGNYQGIGLFLCRFSNCYILYPVGLVYYFPGHP